MVSHCWCPHQVEFICAIGLNQVTFFHFFSSPILHYWRQTGASVSDRSAALWPYRWWTNLETLLFIHVSIWVSARVCVCVCVWIWMYGCYRRCCSKYSTRRKTASCFPANIQHIDPKLIHRPETTIESANRQFQSGKRYGPSWKQSLPFLCFL